MRPPTRVTPNPIKPVGSGAATTVPLAQDLSHDSSVAGRCRSAMSARGCARVGAHRQGHAVGVGDGCHFRGVRKLVGHGFSRDKQTGQQQIRSVPMRWACLYRCRKSLAIGCCVGYARPAVLRFRFRSCPPANPSRAVIARCRRTGNGRQVVGFRLRGSLASQGSAWLNLQGKNEKSVHKATGSMSMSLPSGTS